MNTKQKIFLRQLQLSGIGIIVIVFGIFDSNTAYMIVGACIAVFGILRAILLNKLISKEDDE